MSRTRFKTANIVFFLLLTFLIVYLFNRQKAEQKLIEWGLKSPPDTTNTQVLPPDTGLLPLPSDSILRNNLLPGLQPPDTSGLSTWRILTQGHTGFYVGGPNRFMVQAAEIDPEQITPVVSGSHAAIETIDKEKGLYRLYAQEAGTTEISLFYVNSSGATDVLGSQSFTILAKAPAELQQPDAGYLWSIVTQVPDTLLYGNNNPLIIAVAETAPQSIEASISGQGNELLLTDTANAVYNAVIRTAGSVTITVSITNGTQTRLLGSKQFVVSGAGLPSGKTQADTNNQQPSADSTPVILAQKTLTLYAGIPNTLYLQLPPQTTLQTNNGTLAYNGKTCTITPSKPGFLKLAAQDNNGNPLFNRQFEVVQTPNPAIAISGNSGGNVPAATLQNAKRLELVKVNGFDKPDFTLLSFDLVFYHPNGRGMVKVSNKGPDFNPEILQHLQLINSADLLYFNNIRVAATDGSKRTLSTAVFVAQ